ncbi:phage major capsid protein [Streptomyces sp. DSM 41972]|uniref:Phage major capsid protein n=1 Tax=Streptomyces althioticus subsp. attaecolombicae TaxID=3075534 RepID=A0ABU3HU90_9ACTN|nr:phage major capsid protein [Streptomyces sp. DSM 41972]SCD74932.1 Phage capsid family protein [Streptomyces sp. di50b]SCD85153.1 Phage capsid family protein [Streptomyces sp. di188]
MAINAAQAADHIAKRDAATAKLTALQTKYGNNMPAGARDAEERLLSEISEHDNALRGLVGDAVENERDSADFNHMVSLGAKQRPDEVARRTFSDVRVLGMTLQRTETFSFVERSADALDATDTANWKPAPVMLAEAPNGSQLLGRVQTFTHNSTRGYVPVVPQLQAGIIGRNTELLPDTLTTGSIGTFETVKVMAMVKADHDNLQDYPQLEASIDAALLAALGAGVDDVIVNGGSDGDITVPGLMELGTVTDSAVTVASVLGAVARVKSARAVPDTILMHPNTEAEFLASIDGALLAKLPEIVAISSVPAETAIVAALENTAVAMRENLGVASATDHPYLLCKDQVALAGRARIGDVVVANAAHVQIVRPAEPAA